MGGTLGKSWKCGSGKHPPSIELYLEGRYFTVTNAGMDRFNNGAGSDRAFWLQAYGGRTSTPDRVKDGDAEIVVPHVTWSVVGGIQPDRLATLLLAGDDDGWAARFLYTWPVPQPPRRPRDGLTIPTGREWLTRLRTLP